MQTISHNELDFFHENGYVRIPGLVPWQAQRVAAWRKREPLKASWVEGDPRGKEKQMQPEPAMLTPLGRKLLGLDSWE